MQTNKQQSQIIVPDKYRYLKNLLPPLDIRNLCTEEKKHFKKANKAGTVYSLRALWCQFHRT